jgi:RNA polymerase sigma factor (sigma-70 family)
VSRRAYRRREVTGDPPDRDAFGSAFEDEDRRATLLAALRELPPGTREAVVLRFYLDLPESEIARLLDCRPGTVKSRISRGLRQLAASPALTEPQPSEARDVR